ncbi:SDR family NAD(P)-dependent oxidoreductase [Rhodoplanes sp. TEM]|uniref:SDR family NAD(P)-dependent oxidoreductase n=2 Tax=Nitrobacteraceae TaxID=41294 RepID=A0ABT5JHZ2_RHOTP|nr:MULTISPECIES: SDR family oxidoreductase [Rhodoplanes]MDC7789207.1 SDR family NAD(P)-dependent oxidoreductase [Rhodoplanes tepidamans]MDC7985926.1 SDR family NAD(P)-dependent oxidoreductase [Rhodoplanes sp. TEM]MDQ0357074.1 NAD(P)-dependent dehydrogenase (short-subunit alcohol dehydrogenase family) [Rhodoplanes tepidamans]
MTDSTTVSERPEPPAVADPAGGAPIATPAAIPAAVPDGAPAEARCPFHAGAMAGAPGPGVLAGAGLAPAAAAGPKTMVLTGASRGIGHATVRLFAEAGWRIITCSRQPFDRARCPWEEGPDDHVQVDLNDLRALNLAIVDIKARLGGGPLHALINNAGISPKSPEGGRLSSLTTPVATWMEVLHVNFLAPVLLARGLFDELKAGQGTVVNVTSIVGSRVHPFAGTAYATSKAALACLTREMAHDFAPHGIRVNAIAPGEIKTDILSPDTEARLAPLIPMRRVGSPMEVAKVLHFLCSDAASYVTGEEIHINGGQAL